MSNSKDFDALELKFAKNFVEAMNQTQVRHVLYLGGILNDESLSKHLQSRKAVEDALKTGNYQFSSLRAGIIIGSGSASFEIIRDLVEKLPFMIAPKWLNTLCQPIAIRDVLNILLKSAFRPEIMGKTFDIGGPDVLSYKQMLLGYAKVRGLKRYILTVPVLSPRLSAYWLFFVTSTSYRLATALVSSMRVEVVCSDTKINQILKIKPLSYETAIEKVLYNIKEKQIISSWRDSWVGGRIKSNVQSLVKIPSHGCFVDQREQQVSSPKATIARIWEIGGDRGWYYANGLWKIRGYLDKLVGGVGLRRGRTHPTKLSSGDAVDFWRVVYADKEEGRLLLFAEMRLPGEAWLEFVVEDQVLRQTATFRPKGLFGRLYWYSVVPFHGLIFEGLIKKLAH